MSNVQEVTTREELQTIIASCEEGQGVL